MPNGQVAIPRELIARYEAGVQQLPAGWEITPTGFATIEPGRPGAVLAAAPLATRPPPSVVEPGPGTIVTDPTLAGQDPGILGGIWSFLSPWLLPLLAGGLGMVAGGVLGDENGEPGSDPGTALVPTNGGAVVPSGGYGGNWQAFADFGGFGKGSPQAEGWIHPNRTTDGTGAISAETFRAWDPIQQRYYQLHGTNPYSNITLMPGRVLPGIGGFITKTWVTHAWRKDGSLASTQMAMTSTGRMISLSETGVMKNWRPYRSIVIGKSLTTRNLRRVSTRVKSHAKSLKKILSILK